MSELVRLHVDPRLWLISHAALSAGQNGEGETP
jgi:hypothetical protein